MVARIDDAAAMAKLRASLKAADKEAKKAVARTLGAPETVEKFREAVDDAAHAKLPRRGGLADVIGSSKISVTRRLSGNRPGIFLKLTRRIKGGTIDLPRINKGRLRRPTFGHRPWKTQDVPAGFFDDACDEAGEETTRRMREALHRAVAQISD